MRAVTFGRRCGLRVSEIALGAGNLGTGWGHGADRTEGLRILERFAEAGGTFIDTADVYQAGESETQLGDFLHSERDHFVVASKYSFGGVGQPHLATTGNSRKAMRAAVEQTLARLRTDHLDLYWVHVDDQTTPIEEIVRGLDDLVTAGTIHYAGLSNFPAWRCARAATIADLRDRAPITAVQFEYSLVQRDADRDLHPMAEALGLAACTWSPLAGGLLTGKYRSTNAGRLTALGALVHTEDTPQKASIVDAVIAIAAQLDATPGQVALAWLLEHARRSNTTSIPIIGPRTSEQLAEYLTALSLDLDVQQREQLDRLSTPQLGHPHDAIAAATEPLRAGHADVTRPLLPVG